jgi:DNA-binding PadR family transcriptional regulator
MIPGVKASGMLELPVLGLLKSRDMHGYELRKQLTAMLGPLWGVSWGSLYPTLRRLARAGAVVKLTDDPRAGSSGRANTRRRTVYRITPHGENLFALLLEETGAPADQERFSLRLAFFRYLDPETRLALLERRRAYLLEKLAQFRANLRDYRGRMDRYSLSLQSHDMAATQNDIAWIDELITSEKESDNQPGSGAVASRARMGRPEEKGRTT